MNNWLILFVAITTVAGQALTADQERFNSPDSVAAVTVDSSGTHAPSSDSLVVLPAVVGPLYLQLPLLSEYIRPLEDSIVPPPIPLLSPGSSAGLLHSSGTFFRTLELSTNGSSQFSGGMHFQLTGDLGRNIRVSGVLADETLPLQPEGTTASLEELDRVFLEIEHPYGQISTGDVVIQSSRGRFYQYQRSMVGLESDFTFGSWVGTAALGGSKGIYRTVDLKGQEGNQGPYFLTAKDGNRNITVAAGSEKVWLDGKRLSRGETYDYTIDYSTGELYFTPEHLIHFDSEIHVEYQYLAQGYRQDILEASVEGPLGETGSFEVAYFSERDRSTSVVSRLSREDQKVLKEAGDRLVEESSAVEDSTGEYVLKEGIYVYDPFFSETAARYSLHFIYDGVSGKYRRKISPTGAIYYEFVPEAERAEELDLYSPSRRLTAPTAHRLLHFQGEVPLSKKVKLTAEMAYSLKDNNTLSPLQDRDNGAYAQRLNLLGTSLAAGPQIQMDYALEYWREDTRFTPLQWNRSVTFNSDWDLSWNPNRVNSVTSLKSFMRLGERAQNSLQVSRLESGNVSKNRILNNFTYNGRYLNELKVHYNIIDSQSGYQKNRISVAFLPGRFHPYLFWDHEWAQGRYRYHHVSGGYKYKGKRLETSLGVGQREDWIQEADKTGLSPSSKGYFGEFDYRFKTTTGWNQAVTIRKRIFNDYHSGQRSDFNNYRLNLNYLKRTSPIRYDLMLVSESSLTESRATVYDSVGVGLGYYRYDPQFNDYIRDPTGAYLARTVFTGERKPENRTLLNQRLGIDLGFLPYRSMKHLSYRLDLKGEYRGAEGERDFFHPPKPGKDNVTRSRLYVRHELDYNLVPQRRWKGWKLLSQDLNGYDPRGQEFRRESEEGLSFQETVSEGIKITGMGARHGTTVQSERSSLRNRQFTGTDVEGGIMVFPNPAFKGSFTVVHRFDRGTGSGGEAFRAYSRGVQTNITGFIGKNARLELLMEYHQAFGDRLKTPPEALEGLAPGKTLRLNLEGSYLAGNVLSLILNLRYQNDSRFSDFVTITGELRAQF